MPRKSAGEEGARLVRADQAGGGVALLLSFRCAFWDGPVPRYFHAHPDPLALTYWFANEVAPRRTPGAPATNYV